MVEEGKKDSIPLIIRNRSGGIVDMELTSKKGYGKSLETGKLWHVNRETGRLLPYEPASDSTPAGREYIMDSIQDKGRWIEAVIVTGGTIGDTFKKSTDTPSGSSKTSEIIRADILGKLIGIIKIRKTLMPEGSYTGYLFKEGIGKIKKKLGEETIELLLSPDRSNTVYEAADLLYHFLVFLEAESIDINEILKELESRMDK